MNMFTSFRPLALPLVISALALSGCNNDTGSTVLPGGGHNHDHDHGHSSAPEARKIAMPMRISQVAAHPDVTHMLAFASGNQTLYRVNPESGHQHDIQWQDNDTQARSSHAFSHDGELFAILDNQGRLTVLDTHDWSVKERINLFSGSTPAGTTLVLSGTHPVAFVSDVENGSVHQIDLDSGERVLISSHHLQASGPLAWLGASARQAPSSDHDHHEDHDHDHGHHGHAHHAAVSRAGDHNHDHDHDHEHHDDGAHHADDHHEAITHPGKLVIASGHDHVVVFNLDTQSVENEFHLDYPARSIYTSPDGGFALITQRPDGQPQQVQVLDGGLSIDHGELHVEAARLSTFRLFGERPAHFLANDHRGTLFFDGGNQGPRFVTVTDDSLNRHRIVASESVLAPHHGVALPYDSFVISSNADRDGVVVFVQHGTHYDLAHRFDEPCVHLHGAAAQASYAGFGCEDGLLLVDLGSLSDDHDHDHGHHDHDHGHDDHHDHDHGHDNHHDHDHGHHDHDHGHDDHHDH